MVSRGKRFHPMPLVIVLVILLALTGCSGQTKPGNTGTNTNQTKTIKWDLTSYIALTTNYGQTMNAFTKSVKEKTNGALDITFRPSGELPYKGTEAVRVTGDGSVQMNQTAIGYITGECKTASIPAFPLLAGDTDDFIKAMTALVPVINDELKQYGVEVLFWYPVPSQYIWGTGEPITKFEDLKNQKVRIFDPNQGVILKQIGAVPVSMPVNEVPQAIQRGVCSAAITGAVYAHDAKWADLIKWGYLLPFCGSGDLILVNSKEFAALPDSVKKVLKEEGLKTQEKLIASARSSNEKALAGLKSSGVKIIVPPEGENSRLIKMAAPYWEEWASAKGDAAKKALTLVKSSIGK